MKKQSDYENSQQPTETLPYGKFNNESQPDAGDGTDIIAEHMQDIQYPLYQVLQLAGVIPNGELEDGKNNKQFLTALCNIGIFKHSDTVEYNAKKLTYTLTGGVINVYQSLKDENSSILSDTSSWLNVLRIDSDGKINFLTPTNIDGGSFVPFCVNSGAITDGTESLLSEANNTITAQAPFTITSASGITKKITENLSLDVSTCEPGQYEVMFDFDTSSLFLFSGTIHTGKKFPENAQTGDILFDISCAPYSTRKLLDDGTVKIECTRIGLYDCVSGGGLTV